MADQLFYKSPVVGDRCKRKLYSTTLPKLDVEKSKMFVELLTKSQFVLELHNCVDYLLTMKVLVFVEYLLYLPATASVVIFC